MTPFSALERVPKKDEALSLALGALSPQHTGRQVGPPPTSQVVTASHVMPAREAVYGEFPDMVDDRLRSVLAEGGIDQPYVHQSEAISHALAGRHVVVVTPTASGKTLCYNVPVLSTILAEPTARALYLFPTKALAQDQLAELHLLADRLKSRGEEIGTFTYDGDTPQDARRAIRGRAHVVLSNPEMLHSGILPHHPRWAKLFENLRYVVIDELHAYRGVFGSHLANVLRRLKRICQHYGSAPVFICSSATIANPRELAQHLTEEEFSLVDRNGAPQGEKWFIIVNPPVVNQQLGIRRSYVSETRRIALECLRRQLQIIVFAQSRLTTEVLTTYLKDGSRALTGGADAIRGYRGGYLPLRRRSIERGLREGTVRGVVSTNALELGIDIGSLDVSIMAGYPGTIAATWQRAGRAGRRASRSAAVLVASSAPVDQFVAQHPAFFFEASPEHALVNPDNVQILIDHIKCAAFELPFTADERFGYDEADGDVQSVLGLLAEEGFVHRSDDQWHWVHESYPADAISLRSISSDNFVVIDHSDRTTVIGEVGFSSALSTLHEKAIYMVEGRPYQVDTLDYEGRKAYVTEVDCDYYTDAISYTKVTILEPFDTDDDLGRSHGEVHVVSRVVGFKKIKLYTNENVGSGELDLPERQMHTTAYWLTVPRSVYAALPFTMAERRDGVAGLGIALRSVAQLLLMCERHDIGLAIHGDEERTRDGNGSEIVEMSDEPQIFIYDNYPGGIGFSEPLFTLHNELLSRTYELVSGCLCDSGCPACVGPVGLTGPKAKQVALNLLDALTTGAAVSS
jgi:DEAD/DEAH box helicase domain-containing protein